MTDASRCSEKPRLLLQSNLIGAQSDSFNILNQGVAEEYISREDNHLHCC